jgi:[acyl-carrier-protein] S-malonyltransferase
MTHGIAWLFPGQGSQAVGMGKALADRSPAAARTFAEANETLGFDLRALCWDGPAEALDSTVNAQPALLCTSIAALRAAQEAGMDREPVVCAGHSLGEFSAIVAAGALRFADALRLVRRRGELMHAASDPASGMAAVLGLDVGAVEGAIAGTGVVVANDNAPGQVVVSGGRDALDRASAALKAAGAKRIVPLRVSAAFHSPAMRAIARDLRAAIDAAPWEALRYTVVTNVDAEAHEHARELPDLLERQVWSPVRWVAVVRRAWGEGAALFIEFGAGTVLTGLTKRILPEARSANVNDPATLEEALSLVR